MRKENTTQNNTQTDSTALSCNEQDKISCNCNEAQEDFTCCTGKTKERSEKEYKDLITRLNRIEGQVRGVKGMVEKDLYCVDILTQVSAIQAALNSFNKVLLANHIKTCVADDIRNGNDEVIEELVRTMQKLMR